MNRLIDFIINAAHYSCIDNATVIYINIFGKQLILCFAGQPKEVLKKVRICSGHFEALETNRRIPVYKNGVLPKYECSCCVNKENRAGGQAGPCQAKDGNNKGNASVNPLQSNNHQMEQLEARKCVEIEIPAPEWLFVLKSYSSEIVKLKSEVEAANIIIKQQEVSNEATKEALKQSQDKVANLSLEIAIWKTTAEKTAKKLNDAQQKLWKNNSKSNKEAKRLRTDS